MAPRTKPRWLEYVDLDALVPNPDNPKAHDVEQIDESYRRFRFAEPVSIDERTGYLSAGHGRRSALLEARAAGTEPPEGIVVRGSKWLVPVNRGWSSVDDLEAKAWLVASNRLTERGGWRADVLTSTLEELRAGPGLEGTGYSSGDVDDFLAELGPPPELPPGGADPRQDVRNPVTCPSCGHQFHRV